MNVSVTPSNSSPDAVTVAVGAHSYVVHRHGNPANLNEMARMAADQYFKSGAEGSASFNVILYPES